MSRPLKCTNCGKSVHPQRMGTNEGKWRTVFLHSDSPVQGMPRCYRDPQSDVYAEVDTNTWEGFEATYIYGTDRAIEINMEEEKYTETSPMIVLTYGKYRLVLNPMALKDHLCVDAHAFVDDNDARTGVFGMEDGYRTAFPDDKSFGRSHGWPASALVTLLLGEQTGKEE